ncbi:MAG: VTT domain-containing protein [Dehalococcoidales bacterium]|jgi:uncharacterized membrane protein YdjX (TVP38/TMEM64 family)
MNDSTSSQPGKKGILPWLKKRLIPLAGLLFGIGIVVAVAVFYMKNPGFFKNLQDYKNKDALIGYGAVFVISIFLNATIIIPVSAMTVILVMGGILPLPWVVGLVGGLAAGIGEQTAYIVGRSGREIMAKNKIYLRVERWVNKWGFLAIFLLSVFPLAFDVAGIIGGATRMTFWKFFVATWLGRTLTYVVVAYLGHYGLKALPGFAS